MQRLSASSKKLIVILVAVLVAVCIGLALHHHGSHATTTSGSTDSTGSSTASGSSSQPQPTTTGGTSSGQSSSSTTSSSVKSAGTASSAPAANAPRTASPPTATTITVDASGFHPDAVYVASGATVTWTNTGHEPHQIAPSLNPYVQNQPLAAMHSPVLQPGQSYSFVISYDMTQSGSAGYYDTNTPAHKGDIAVAKP